MAVVVGLLAGLLPGTTWAFDGLTNRQELTLPSLTTAAGATIAPVRTSWESWGTLNAARDNAILVTPHFFATAHAAGRYADAPGQRGYWDDLIGPGKALDTERYFVFSLNVLATLNARDPHVLTTGPASLDPATGKPYGLRFPVVGIHDFVELERALVDQLGITRLHAVVGASMGALQALEWAASHPERVGRVAAVVGGARVDPFVLAWFDRWAAPIRLDPAWHQGDYYDGPGPEAGLTEAITIAALQSRQSGWAEAQFGRAWADPARDPRTSLSHRYAIEGWLERVIPGAAKLADANHLLYLVRAVQSFTLGDPSGKAEDLSRLRAPVLLLPAAGDLLFPPAEAEALRDRLSAQGTPVDLQLIQGQAGHLDGVASTTLFAQPLKSFVEK